MVSASHTPKVGQQISISGTIVNHQQTSQNYAYIVQISDTDDVVADISWQQASVESGHTSKISTSWIPQEAGIYTVKIFVWDGVSDSPLLLSDVTVNFLQISQR